MTDTDCLDYSKVYSLIYLMFHLNKLRIGRLSYCACIHSAAARVPCGCWIHANTPGEE